MALLRFTLLSSAAFCLVWLLRPLGRKFGGARFAYCLWIVVPLVMVVGFCPPPPPSLNRLFHPINTAPQALASRLAPSVSAAGPLAVSVYREASEPVLDHALKLGLLVVWAVGAILALLRAGWLQNRFVRRLGRLTSAAHTANVYYAERSGAGPAVYGLWRSKIVLPPDFASRFEPEEQALIIAHERTHLREGHTFVGAIALLMVCAQWFNPLAHLAFRLLRIDQELACDASVIKAHPKAKAIYARAMLKARGNMFAPPLAYGWRYRVALPMKTRIDMLRAPKPAAITQTACGGGLLALAVGACFLAYATVPMVYGALPKPLLAAAPSVQTLAASVAQSVSSAKPISKPKAPKLSPVKPAIPQSAPVVAAAPDKDALIQERAQILADYAARGGSTQMTVNGKSVSMIDYNQFKAIMGDAVVKRLDELDAAINPPNLTPAPINAPQQFTVPPGMSEDEAARAIGLGSALGYGGLITGPFQPHVMVKCFTPQTPANARCPG